MKKNLSYFMRSTEPEVITAPGPSSIKDEEGNVVDLQIMVLSQATISKINKNYTQRSVATDGRGNPLVLNGEVVWKVERDAARATAHMIVEALQYPNLRDPELMAYYGCKDITDMPMAVFSRPAEFSHVSKMVMSALGLSGESSTSSDKELEDAKN